MKIFVDHDYKRLPAKDSGTISVQIYDRDGVVAENGIRPREDIATIGKPVFESIKNLGVKISDEVMDFLTLSLAVTAADSFVVRDNMFDGWTRDLNLTIRMNKPKIWIANKVLIEKALHFLSGDVWSLNFLGDGKLPPEPSNSGNNRKKINLNGINCVSLFSGGLDSAIGVIDLISANKTPLLISHSYKGDKSKQDFIANEIRKKGSLSRFSANAHPVGRGMPRDITMRTRSINFLAFALVGANAANQENTPDFPIYVPENGFISLNAPLTIRRIGALSTRTTHPFFIEMIQDLFNKLKFNVKLLNPYQFSTKGEMVKACSDKSLLKKIVSDTVSCSHWKRKNKQCGYCVPCMIRRASLLKGKVIEKNDYHHGGYKTLRGFVKNRRDLSDDVISVMMALDNLSKRKTKSWIMKSGKLNSQDIDDFDRVFKMGLNEVKAFLKQENLL